MIEEDLDGLTAGHKQESESCLFVCCVSGSALHYEVGV